MKYYIEDNIVRYCGEYDTPEDAMEAVVSMIRDDLEQAKANVERGCPVGKTHYYSIVIEEN